MKSFSALLDALMAAPADRQPAISQLIFDTFQVRKAVLALDMSGFVLSVRRDGILSHLCRIRRMQRLTRPLVEAHAGDVVKYEADNLLAVFDDPRQAVQAAVAMNRAAAAAGDGLSLSSGIAYGDALLVPGADCFGDAVNLAFKLGEDVARAGEILVTEEVRARLDGDPLLPTTPTLLSVSGVELTAYSVTYAATDPGAAAPDGG